MKKTILLAIMVINSMAVYSQNCGEFELFNFTDTIITDWIWSEPRNGFYFDMRYDTLTAANTGYISFYLVDDSGDTITNKEYYEWSHFFPFSSNDTMRYTMVLDSNLNSLPVDFTGFLVTANPECQIPISFITTGIEETSNLDIVNVFPNPTNGILWTGKLCSEIRVFNMSGELVVNSTNNNTIDLSKLNRGMYLIQLLLPNAEIINRRIIKY